MTSASRPSFLRHFGRGPAPRQAPDLADMGTAFALDQSMDPFDHDAKAAREPAPRVVPVAGWRLWLGRKLGN